jgi:hypothetical protein
MSNKVYAKEWLLFAYKNIDTAQKLFEMKTSTLDINFYDKIISSLHRYKNRKS